MQFSTDTITGILLAKGIGVSDDSNYVPTLAKSLSESVGYEDFPTLDSFLKDERVAPALEKAPRLEQQVNQREEVKASPRPKQDSQRSLSAAEQQRLELKRRAIQALPK